METRMRGWLAILFVALAASEARGAQAADSGAFVITLGADTVAVERYTRSGDRLVDDMVLRDRAPVIVRRTVATLGPDGTIARLELANGPAGGAPGPTLHGVARFTPEQTFFEVVRDGRTTPASVITPVGTLPFFNFCYALYEQVGRRARALGTSPVTVPAIGFSGTRAFDLTVTFSGADSMAIGFDDEAPTLMQVDALGRILGADGRLTTQKVLVTRVPTLDIPTLAARFAGRPLGTLSPRDSVRATISGARIAIDYSRPATRHRTIFGGIVPWNAVWRTGANAATRFTTSADLEMGGATIPRGSYTLWTLPSPAGWKLIINTQTRASCTGAACALPTRPPLWGTDYSPDSDLVRLDVNVEQTARPVERFTIAVEPQDSVAVLLMEWETTRLWIPLRRKQP